MQLKTLHDVDLKDKKVLLRLDLNVPMQGKTIMDNTRIRKAIPTIQTLLMQNAKVIICTHLGRPEGQIVEELRLDPIAERLSNMLKQPVKKMNQVISEEVYQVANNLKSGEIMMIENLRFDPRETKNDDSLSAELAKLADVFVSDGFGVLHRAHCSTVGISKYLPAYAGLLVEKEIKILSTLFIHLRKPAIFIVAGSKMKTKLALIERFLKIADKVVIGGGIANTFFVAQGKNIGSSLYEAEEVERAKNILQADINHKIYLPKDVVVAKEITADTWTKQLHLDDFIEADDKILDIGNESTQEIVDIIKSAGTVVWNGPVGLYELKPFAWGSRMIARAMADSSADTIIGGGDTADVVFSFGCTEEQFTHISTGGGASLEFLGGKDLPGIQVLTVNLA